MRVQSDMLIRESERLAKLLARMGIDCATTYTNPVSIEATYWPVGGAAAIQLFGVHDGMLPAPDGVLTDKQLRQAHG